MESRWRVIGLIACALMLAAQTSVSNDVTVRAQETSVGEKVKAQIRRCLERRFTWIKSANHFEDIGGAVAVNLKGETVFAEGYGYANLEWRVAATPKTKFRIWSLSKTFTATAAMILSEQGKLRLDDPICKHLVSCPAGWKSITVRQLATNTSGIPDITATNFDGSTTNPTFKARFKGFSDDPAFRAPVSRAEAIDIFGSAPLLFPPGKGYDYSNPGFYVLALVIERASGQTYEQALRTLIFSPLGMNDSGSYVNERITEGMADGYQRDVNSQAVRAIALDYSWLLGSAGLYSTAEDLAKFDHAIYTALLLPKDKWQQMQVLPSPASTPKGGYGFGLEIFFEPTLNRWGHFGAGPGFNSHFFRYADDDLTLINLTNLGIPTEDLVPQVRAIIDAKGMAGAEVMQQCGP